MSFFWSLKWEVLLSLSVSAAQTCRFLSKMSLKIMEIMESLRHCSLHFRHLWHAQVFILYRTAIWKKNTKRRRRRKVGGKKRSTHLQMDWQFHKLKLYFLPHVVEHLNLHFEPHHASIGKTGMEHLISMFSAHRLCLCSSMRDRFFCCSRFLTHALLYTQECDWKR